MQKDFRFYCTYMSWFGNKISNDFIKKRPILLFILVGIIAFVVYHISLPINFSFYPIKAMGIINDLLNLNYINDEIVKNMISSIVSSSTIVVSLLSAIYVFTYREQKSVSPSASTNTRKNTIIILVICSIIFNLIFGNLIIGEFNSLLTGNPSPSLDITKYLFTRIIFLGLSMIILLNFIVKLIKYLFRTMSVESMLIDSVKQSSKRLTNIIYMDRSDKFSDLLDDSYKKFHYSLESVFQNLNFAAENNMNKEFEENINEFKLVFGKLKTSIDKHNINNTSSYLLEEDGTNYVNAYNSALRSNLSLIYNLMKKHQYNKAKKAVSLYFHLFLESDDTLKKVFKISLNDFVDFVDTSDERQILIFIEGLNSIRNEDTLLTYKFLLMKLINKNELINLTNLIYDSQKYVENPILKGSVLTILLQNLIKSIEISNYEITGFLVKFLVTNFSGQEINRRLVFLGIKNNRHAYSSVLEVGERIDGIDENGIFAIKINNETFEYCYKKAFILLYSQHLYSINNNLWYTKKWKEIGNEIELKKEFSDCNYSEYILSKVKFAEKKYGLLFFQDDKVMKKVYYELGLKFPKALEEKNNLFNSLNQGVIKLFNL